MSVRTGACFLLLLFSALGARAQTPPAPWSGVISRESLELEAPWNTQYRTFKDAISGDGRYVVFRRSFDLNTPGDILLRDRYTGDLRKLNVAWDGSEPYAPSDAASISANGRHVIFVSCGRLTADDLNDFCDLYARDLETDSIVRITVGPQGEDPVAPAGYGSISNDGRYIAFTAQFDAPYPGLPRLAWLRDRDADQNGLFDEPGSITTTMVSVKWDGSPAAVDYSIAINGGDARFVAFTSSDPEVVPNPAGAGVHLYVRDLQWSTTSRIDRPTPGTADDGWSSWPDFSDDGSVLVYESTARVADDDYDSESDVFLFNMWTGGNVQVLPGETSASPNDRVILPAISGDGRYVAVAAQLESTGAWAFFPWVYDRTLEQYTRIVPKAEGPQVQPSILELSLTTDGSELLFWSEPYGVIHDYWPYGGAVFVASPFTLTPSEQAVPPAGGTFTAHVSVPPGIKWTVTTPYGAWLSIEPATGNGPGTFTFTVPPNAESESHAGYIWLGSHQILVTQAEAPSISAISPWDGPVAGGTLVSIAGGGFRSGAAVTFDGVASTAVNVVNANLIEAVSPPHPMSGPVEVRVTNTDGLSAARMPGFRYSDTTPPVVDYTLTGPEGSNGFYTGDVTITWTTTDPESDVVRQGCETRTFTEDGTFYQFCQADSEGGTTVRWATVPRDSTGPEIQVFSPWYPPAQVATRYPRGSAVPAYYSCSDAVSGVSTCAGDVADSQNIDTSTAGTFTFTVRSKDTAGNESTKATPYVVVAPTALTLDDVSATYGGSASFVARLAMDGNPVAGQIVAFAINGVPLGSATTAANGVATLTVSLTGRTAGPYTASASFEEIDIYAAASATAALTVHKAMPTLVWSQPPDIVYGTSLTGAQLNATASVPGTFNYSPAAGAMLSTGFHVLTAAFTPSDSENYASAAASTTLRVTRAPTTITWAAPAPIGYGTPLGGAQLNASASVPGTFSYTPAIGAALPAGNHVLSVVFTPADWVDYEPAASSVQLSVVPAPLTIFANNSSKVYGAALPGFTASATGFVYSDTMASLSGSLSFSTPATPVSSPGTYSVTPGGVASSNYAISFAPGVLTVTKAATTLAFTTSPNPSTNNKPVQLMAQVAVVAPGAGTATGTVEFRENNTVLGTATLVNGVATLTVSFRKGTHQLTATWGGNTNMTGSSGSATHRVN